MHMQDDQQQQYINCGMVANIVVCWYQIEFNYVVNDTCRSFMSCFFAHHPSQQTNDKIPLFVLSKLLQQVLALNNEVVYKEEVKWV